MLPRVLFSYFFHPLVKITLQAFFHFLVGIKDLSGFAVNQSGFPADFAVIGVSQTKLPVFLRASDKIPAVHIYLLIPGS